MFSNSMAAPFLCVCELLSNLRINSRVYTGGKSIISMHQAQKICSHQKRWPHSYAQNSFLWHDASDQNFDQENALSSQWTISFGFTLPSCFWWWSWDLYLLEPERSLPENWRKGSLLVSLSEFMKRQVKRGFGKKPFRFDQIRKLK